MLKGLTTEQQTHAAKMQTPTHQHDAVFLWMTPQLNWIVVQSNTSHSEWFPKTFISDKIDMFWEERFVALEETNCACCAIGENL